MCGCLCVRCVCVWGVSVYVCEVCGGVRCVGCVGVCV